MTMSAPAAARASTTALPMPELPPVTTATLPFSVISAPFRSRVGCRMKSVPTCPDPALLRVEAGAGRINNAWTGARGHLGPGDPHGPSGGVEAEQGHRWLLEMRRSCLRE